MVKQKMVINVRVSDQKRRSRALKIVVAASGVESAALQGNDKDQIVVVGDGVDVVNLTAALRKSMGYAELVSVGPAGDKKEEEKKETKNELIVHPPYIWPSYAHQYPPNYQMVCEYRDYPNHNDPNCSVM